MQASSVNICLKNAYFPQIKKNNKNNNSKQIQTRCDLTLLPSYKASRAYAVINFGHILPAGFATIEGYKKLGSGQISSLSKSVKSDLSINNIYTKDEGLEILENIANEILNRYKNERLVSLGRSPIPILEMAKSMKNGISDYDFISFSRGYTLNSINTRIWKSSKENPTRKQLDCYRKYLKTISMDPETIINKARNGKKTVIIDYCQTGQGMRAFLEILRDWALEQKNYEDLKNAVITVPMFHFNDRFINLKKEYLTNRGKIPILKKKISISLFEEFNANRINLSKFDHKHYLVDIFNHVSGTYFEKEYPASKWTEAFPIRGPEQDHKINSNLARFAIIDYLARKNSLRD